METPLTKTTRQVTDIVWNRVPGMVTDDMMIFCNQQMFLLEAIYRSMMDFKMHSLEEITPDAEGVIHIPSWKGFDTDKAFLDYFSLVNILNQLGRVLENKYAQTVSVVPVYNRVRFFRNKVSEHWDDYTRHLTSGSISQEKGKPAIAIVAQEHSKEERLKIIAQIKSLFKSLGLEVDLSHADNASIGNRGLYSEQLYEALERIDPSLNCRNGSGDYLISNQLVELLFKLGFPVPISDVEEYYKNLSQSMKLLFKL